MTHINNRYPPTTSAGGFYTICEQILNQSDHEANLWAN